jgi:hypothetical protein
MKPTTIYRKVYLGRVCLSMTPWAANALPDEEQERLARRAQEMGVRVSIGKSNHEWTIRVVSDMTRTRYGRPEPLASHSFHHLKGDPAKLVDHCLDQYAERETWTPDELVTAAVQSGLDVTRA